MSVSNAWLCGPWGPSRPLLILQKSYGLPNEINLEFYLKEIITYFCIYPNFLSKRVSLLFYAINFCSLTITLSTNRLLDLTRNLSKNIYFLFFQVVCNNWNCLRNLLKVCYYEYSLCQQSIARLDYPSENFSVESGRNSRFRHETSKVIPQISTRLKYTAFARWILMHFSYPSKKIDVFSAENLSVYAVFRHIFQRWKHQFFF